MTISTQPWESLLEEIDLLEREGTQALATRTIGLDGSGRRIPGEFWRDPGRLEIQKLYADALHAVPPKLRTRVLKGYLAHHPVSAWDPNSWFISFWWELRGRRDPEAKRLLKAIGSGIQAPADLGISKHRAREWRLKWGRSLLKKYWLPQVPVLSGLHREYRNTERWSRRADGELTERAADLRKDFVARFHKLTGYAPTRHEVDTVPFSRMLLRAASRACGVSERLLHNRAQKSVAAF